MAPTTAEKALEKVEITPGIVLVNPAAVVRLWPQLERRLKAVVKPQTGHTLDSVLTGLQTGEFHAWIIDDFKAVLVTNIVRRPTQSVLWVYFAAGKDADKWLTRAGKALRKIAKKWGCRAVEFAGRPGWRKIHKQYPEYRDIGSIYRSEVN